MNTQKTMYEQFKSYAAECGEDRFLFDEERSYTAAEAFRTILAIGNRLHEYGVKEGATVLYRCTRSIDGYLIYLALVFLGATVAMTDPHQTAEDFIRNSAVPFRADFIVSNERAMGGTAANGDWEVFGCGPLEVGKPAETVQNFTEGRDVSAPATIFFTSGSTGKSKGAVISQRALLQRAADLTSEDWYHEGDIVMVTLPIHHGFGLVLVQTAFFARYSLFFPRENNVEYALDCIGKYRVTGMDAVPSYFYAMAQANERNARDVSTLRIGFTGGSPVFAEQHRYIEKMLTMALHIQYAMSECMSISNTFPQDGPEVRGTTVGRAHRDAVVILGEDGNELPHGKEGEICVFGPAVMSGYYNNEEETERVIDAKGRFHTGDLGFFDGAGYLHISGRLKDIIIRNGLNLSPIKIEDGIRSLPEVEEAAVVGVRDERMGEAPCAMVVFRAGYSVTEEELAAKLSQVMPKNEVPVRFLFAEALPLNPIGKPDKRKIKTMFE